MEVQARLDKLKGRCRIPCKERREHIFTAKATMGAVFVTDMDHI